MLKRFIVLDSWRGICALLVAIFHFTTLNHIFYSPIVRNSWLFVDFFFVLSGFVITHAYVGRLTSAVELGAFALRRLGRVWPLHIFMLALFFALELAKYFMMQGDFTADRPAFSGSTAPDAILRSVLLLQALPFWPTTFMNGPSWSISTEYWTYLIFGVIAVATYALSRFRDLALLICQIVLVAFSLAVLVAGAGGLDAFDLYPLPRCILGFMSGCIAYDIWKRWQPDLGSRVVATGVEAQAIVLIFLFVSYAADSALQFLAPVVFGSGILIFSMEAGFLSALMTRRVFVLLGQLSFSIYMTHTFLHEIYRKAISVLGQKTGAVLTQPVSPDLFDGAKEIVTFGGVWFGDFTLVFYLLATVAFSWLTYRLVEMPGQKLFNSLAARLRPAAPQPARAAEGKPAAL